MKRLPGQVNWAGVPSLTTPHQTHAKPARRIDPKMCWIDPVLSSERGMRWTGTVLIARSRTDKKGLIEAFQRFIFNGITVMAPRFGVQAAVLGFTVHSYTVKAARDTLEGLKSDFVVIALWGQFQGEADLQLWIVA